MANIGQMSWGGQAEWTDEREELVNTQRDLDRQPKVCDIAPVSACVCGVCVRVCGFVCHVWLRARLCDPCVRMVVCRVCLRVGCTRALRS